MSSGVGKTLIVLSSIPEQSYCSNRGSAGALEKTAMLLVEQRNASSINSDRLLFQPWLCDVDSIHFLHCATVHYKLMESGTPEIDSRVSFISLKSSLIQ